jgi:hypothetical protein
MIFCVNRVKTRVMSSVRVRMNSNYKSRQDVHRNESEFSNIEIRNNEASRKGFENSLEACEFFI